MNCSDWEERIALHAGGDLPPAEVAEVERHLRECAGCRASAAAFGRGLELLREVHQEPLAPVHFAVVRAGVLAKLERKRRWAWAYGFAVATGALVVLLAPWPGRMPEPPVAVVSHPPAPQLTPVVEAPAVHGARVRRARQPAARPAEPLMIKLITDDPNVVIYWIADTKGEPK